MAINLTFILFFVWRRPHQNLCALFVLCGTHEARKLGTIIFFLCRFRLLSLVSCCCTQCTGNKATLSLCRVITALCTQTSHFVFKPFPRWCLHILVHLSSTNFFFHFGRVCLVKLQFLWLVLILQQRSHELQWNHKFGVTMLCEHFKISLPICGRKTMARHVRIY